MLTPEKVKEKSKKKRSISSFTILLIILIVLALVTVVMSLAGVEGIAGATVANVATAPVKGFTDALPVCLFVLILGGFLGIVTETGALDSGIAALVKKLKGNELILIPILSRFLHRRIRYGRAPRKRFRSTCCSRPPWSPQASTALSVLRSCCWALAAACSARR